MRYFQYFYQRLRTPSSTSQPRSSVHLAGVHTMRLELNLNFFAKLTYSSTPLQTPPADVRPSTNCSQRWGRRGRTPALETQVRAHELFSEKWFWINSLTFCTGGPLITEEKDGSFTLVGILSGGGLNCSLLKDPNYDWKNKTGKWMRVGSFEKWIQSIIFQETEPSKIISSFHL